MKKIIIIGIMITFLIVILGIFVNTNNKIKELEESKIQHIFEPGDHEFFLEHNGLERKYLVYVPSSYKKEIPTPLVFGIHGGGGTANGFKKSVDLDSNAEKNNYIVVYPDGTNKKTPDKKLSWNSGMGTVNPTTEKKADDVEFFSDIIDDITTKFSIDEDRIYATGISKGGQMAYRLGCDLTDRIAAVVAVAVPVSTDVTCEPSGHIPIMIIHGMKDPRAPFEGGECEMRSDDLLGTVPYSEIPATCESVDDVANFWVDNNSCSLQPSVTYQKGDVACQTFDKCIDESEVILCISENAGHTWPGMPERNYASQSLVESVVGKVTYDISNEQIWGFLSKHYLK